MKEKRNKKKPKQVPKNDSAEAQSESQGKQRIVVQQLEQNAPKVVPSDMSKARTPSAVPSSGQTERELAIIREETRAKRHRRKEAREEARGERGEASQSKVSVSTQSPSQSMLGTTIEESFSVVEFTETSYTSASLETIVEIESQYRTKRKKKKKKMELRGDVSRATSSIKSIASSRLLSSSVFSEDQSLDTKKQRKKPKKKTKPKPQKEKSDKIQYPVFEKPANWATMTMTDQEEWMRQRIIQYNREMEAERLRQIALAKEKKKQDRIRRSRLIVVEKMRQAVRDDILAKTCELFKKYELKKEKHDYEDLEEIEEYMYTFIQWENYLNAVTMPSPIDPPQLNTYLHKWREMMSKDCTEEELKKRFDEVIPLIDLIDIFMATKYHMTPETIENIKEVRIQLRSLLVKAVHCTSFELLQDIEHKLGQKDLKLAKWHVELKNLDLTIWVALKPPTRLKGGQFYPMPKPLVLDFPVLYLQLILPKQFEKSDVCVRVAHSRRDLCSPSNSTWGLALELPDETDDFYTFCCKEIECIQNVRSENEETLAQFHRNIENKIKELQRYIKRSRPAEIREAKKEIDELRQIEPPELFGDINPRDRCNKEQDDHIKMYMVACLPILGIGEVNLRKYRICGGVLYVNLYQKPMQPKYIRGMYLSTFPDAKLLKEIRFEVDIDPPSVDEDSFHANIGSPDVEAEDLENDDENAKNTPAVVPRRVDSSTGKEHLVTFNLMLPEDVIWFQLPLVCQWEERGRVWSTNHVYDFKQNEDTSIRFRTTHLWPIGFAQLRYINLPYQEWELKRHSHGFPYEVFLLRRANGGWIMENQTLVAILRKGVLFTLIGTELKLVILCRNRCVVLKEVTNMKPRPPDPRRPPQPDFAASGDFNVPPMPSEESVDDRPYTIMGDTSSLDGIVGRPMTVDKFKRALRDAGCDIFPEFDSHNYVDRTCVKTWPMEKHLYHAIAMMSKAYNFKSSRWNNGAGFRNIICQIREQTHNEMENSFRLLHVTPEFTTLLRNDEDSMTEFDSTSLMPADFYPDLFTLHLSYGSEIAQKIVYNMSYQITETVYELLHEVKPFSFSR